MLLNGDTRAEANQAIASTLNVAAAAGVVVTPLGVARRLEGPRLYRGLDADWVLTDIVHDPLYKTGRFPIPRGVRRQLRRLDQGGLALDAVYVAHELPARAPYRLAPTNAAEPLPLTPAMLDELITHPGPSRATRSFTATAGRVAQQAGAFISRSASSTLRMLETVETVLVDPVLLGAQHLDGTGLAVIYELARWDW